MLFFVIWHHNFRFSSSSNGTLTINSVVCRVHKNCISFYQYKFYPVCNNTHLNTYPRNTHLFPLDKHHFVLDYCWFNKKSYTIGRFGESFLLSWRKFFLTFNILYANISYSKLSRKINLLLQSRLRKPSRRVNCRLNSQMKLFMRKWVRE